MAVSETIQEILQGIDEAQYGRDMRQFIHKGIQKCYEEGSAGETDLEARESIEKILEIFGDVESGDTASKAYAIGDSVVYDGRLYRVTAAIAQGDEFEEGTNIEETQAAGDVGDAYSIPTSIATGMQGVNADCQLVVMPGAKIMQLFVHIDNTLSSDFSISSINYVTKLPIPYKSVYFGLYKYDSITASGFSGAPLVVCRIRRANASNDPTAPYTQGCLMMQGIVPANKQVYGCVTIPYYALHPDHPISTGTLIDATTDWDVS